MSDSVPQLLTLLTVAKALCVSPHTVRSWVRKERLRPIRLCRRLLFHPNEIALSGSKLFRPNRKPPICLRQEKRSG